MFHQAMWISDFSFADEGYCWLVTCRLSSPGVVNNPIVLVLRDVASLTAVEFNNDITLFFVGVIQPA